jgi:hypothetical protein
MGDLDLLPSKWTAGHSKPGEVRPALNSPSAVRFDLAKLHLFDATSGLGLPLRSVEPAGTGRRPV